MVSPTNWSYTDKMGQNPTKYKVDKMINEENNEQDDRQDNETTFADEDVFGYACYNASWIISMRLNWLPKL